MLEGLVIFKTGYPGYLVGGFFKGSEKLRLIFLRQRERDGVLERLFSWKCLYRSLVSIFKWCEISPAKGGGGGSVPYEMDRNVKII